MSADKHVALVKDFYKQLLSGNLEDILTHFLAPDVVWENPLPESIPFGGTFQGHEGVRRYMGLIFEHLDINEFTIAEFISQGDSVVAFGSEASLVKSTGRSYRMDWVHVLRIANDRIRHIREYNDTAAMVVAFRGN